MNRKQIRRDYENIDYIDAKGRVRTKVHYRGALYTLEDPEQIVPFRVLYAVLVVLSIALFILPLCFNLDALRTMYFTVFYVPQIFCVFVMGLGMFNVLFTRLPYREEVYSTVFSRARVAAVACAALSLVSVVTFAVFAGLNHAQGTEYLVLGCVLGQLLVDVAFFLNVRVRAINRIAPPEPAPAESAVGPSASAEAPENGAPEASDAPDETSSNDEI